MVTSTLAAFVLAVGSIGGLSAGVASAITPTSVPNPLPKPTVARGDVSATVSWTPQYGSTSVGDSFSCYDDATGSVNCWGINDQGQLGHGDNVVSDTPVQVSGLTGGVTAIASGVAHTCALTTADAVWCWGANTAGQLGDGTGTTSNTPVAVTGLPADVATIFAGGNDSCALTTAGALYCWGANNHGQLGDGSTTNGLAPKRVFAVAGTVKQAASSVAHMCVINTVGDAWCAGSNATGQLGISRADVSDHTAPVKVPLIMSMLTIATSAYATCGVGESRHLQCWGGVTGDDTAYGNGVTTGGPAPAGPFMNNAWTIGSYGVSLFDGGGCTYSSVGTVDCWGDNTHGQASQPEGWITLPSPQFAAAWVTSTVVSGPSSTCVVAGISGINCWGKLHSGDAFGMSFVHGLSSTDAISTYVATAHPGGQSCSTNRDGTSCKITGLQNGQTYTFTVRAANSVGDGPESPASDPLAIGQATPPVIDPDSVVSGAGSLTFAWSAPDGQFGAFLSSTVQWRVSGTATWKTVTVSAPTVQTTLEVPEGADIQVQVSVTCNGLPSLYSTPLTFTTEMFGARAGATSTVIRPAKDGFEDATTLTVSANGSADGVLNVLDSHNKIVRHWTLDSGNSWQRSWNGASDTGKRLPFGTYRAVASMSFQSKAHKSSVRSITIAPSQVGTPSLALEGSAVYPIKDGYGDYVYFNVSSSLPAAGTVQVSKGSKVLWTLPLSRSQVWYRGWNGHTSGGKVLPAGTYTLTVTLKGLEGTARSTKHAIKVSSQHLAPSSFTTSSSAADAYVGAADGAPSVNNTGTVALHSDPYNGNFDIALFSIPMPTSLKVPTKVRFDICISGVQGSTQAPVVEFTNSRGAPIGQPSGLPTSPGCYRYTGQFPGGAFGKNRLYVAVGNADTNGVSLVVLKSFALSGTKYTLK